MTSAGDHGNNTCTDAVPGPEPSLNSIGNKPRKLNEFD